MQEFKIPKENLPSKSTDVIFIEPTFGLRRQAAKRYPTNAHYPMEDLLMGMCIKVDSDPNIPPPDPLSIVQSFPLADSQYLSAVFLTMFTLDEDLSNKAQNLGTSFKEDLKETCTIRKEDMPLQSFSVTFRKPNLKERHQAEKMYPGADSNCGYSLEELLFARSVLAIDGERPNNSDPISILNEWPHVEAQYAVAVFLNSSTLSKSDVTEAQQLGKSLRDQFSTQTGQDDSLQLRKPKKVEATTQA